MNAWIPEGAVSELSEYVKSRMGICFPADKLDDLEKKIGLAADSLGFEDAASCIKWILSSRTDKRQVEILASFLTVGETYFFREIDNLNALTKLAFPEIAKAHADGDRRMRIWSAGCSTGEEPYTMAMLVSESAAFRDWNVSILGTDINQASLSKAQAGVYTEWSFRGVDAAAREKYFKKGQGGTFEVLPAFKSMVSFAHLNLIDDIYPALLNSTNAIDLILCRNVLMYFTPEYAQKVIRKFRRSLLPQGWFVVSPVEVPMLDGESFMRVVDKDAVLHRKVDGSPGPRVASAPLSEPLGDEGAAAPPAPPSRPRSLRSPRRPEAPPPPAPATYERAEELFKDADYDGAIRALSALAALPLVEARVFRLLSRSYANKGMLSDSEAWCLRAIEGDSTSAANRYLHALILIERGKLDEAVTALREAIYLESGFVMARFMLADLYDRKRKSGESELHLKNALDALRNYRSEEELPESEGMTAGMLIETITATLEDRRANEKRRVAGRA
jgi:chemotaxis protein methyltransferase CheR